MKIEDIAFKEPWLTIIDDKIALIPSGKFAFCSMLASDPSGELPPGVIMITLAEYEGLKAHTMRFNNDRTAVVPYEPTEEEKQRDAADKQYLLDLDRIEELKRLLQSTDYKQAKFIDGAFTEAEYADIREQRAAWRNEINQVEESIKTYLQQSGTPVEIEK